MTDRLSDRVGPFGVWPVALSALYAEGLLSRADLCTFAALTSRLDYRTGTGTVRISEIAERATYGRTTVRASLDHLVLRGIVHRKRKGGGAYRFRLVQLDVGPQYQLPGVNQSERPTYLSGVGRSERSSVDQSERLTPQSLSISEKGDEGKNEPLDFDGEPMSLRDWIDTLPPELQPQMRRRFGIDELSERRERRAGS